MRTVLVFFLFLFIVFFSWEVRFRNSDGNNVTEAWDNVPSSVGIRRTASKEKDDGWERELIRRLDGGRQTASYSDSQLIASHRLRFADLLGNYRLVTVPTEKGRIHIRELEFVDSPDLPGTPVLVADWEKFFQVNKDVFGLEHVLLDQQIQNPSNDGWVTKTFSSTTIRGEKVRVLVTQDSNGRVYRIAIQ